MELSDTDIFLCCIIGFPILFLCILGLYLNVIQPFVETREYIKGEINRSDGGEYYYWKRELRNLYIEHIP
ncbi:MAG: hypothetical protein ACI4IL_05685, partial [Eubacterium sp.]